MVSIIWSRYFQLHLCSSEADRFKFRRDREPSQQEDAVGVRRAHNSFPKNTTSCRLTLTLTSVPEIDYGSPIPNPGCFLSHQTKLMKIQHSCCPSPLSDRARNLLQTTSRHPYLELQVT